MTEFDKPRIVIVDDNQSQLRGLKRALTLRGVEVAAFTDTKSATEAIAENAKIDLAVIDFNLGFGGDSSEFIRDVIIPRGIEFARLTSEVDDIPVDVRGKLVIDKSQNTDEISLILNAIRRPDLIEIKPVE